MTIPTSALKKLANKTDADLTVRTPVGDVKLPNAAMADLGSSGSQTVTVRTEREGDAVSVTVMADDKVLDSIDGGVDATLAAKEVSDDTVAVLVGDDGSETIIKKSYVEAGLLHAHIPGSATVRTVENEKDFVDVDDSWAKSAIHFTTSRELFNGVDGLHFAPNGSMTRSMLVTVLYRLEDAKETGKSAFADVAADTWYSDAVAWANDSGIVTGKSDRQFAPDEMITREQLATILYRYATKLCGQAAVDGKSDALSDYSDVTAVSSFAQDGMIWAVEMGIINGRDGHTLAPGGTASRAEVSTMLMRFIKAIS